MCMETIDFIDQKHKDIIYDVSQTDLTKLGFQRYFSGYNNQFTDSKPLSSYMVPPKDTSLVFFGCGKNGKYNGVIAKTDEIFDHKGKSSFLIMKFNAMNPLTKNNSSL